MKQKKRHYGINVGSSSILLIFVILCLVSFAVLSIVSAQADNKLSQKLAQKTTVYYEACNEAEVYLYNLVNSLDKIYQSSSSKEEYFSIAGENTSFSLPLSEQQNLDVALTILYPGDSGNYYRIDSWQVTTLDTLELDDTLPLFQGEFPFF